MRKGPSLHEGSFPAYISGLRARCRPNLRLGAMDLDHITDPESLTSAVYRVYTGVQRLRGYKSRGKFFYSVYIVYTVVPRLHPIRKGDSILCSS